MTQDQKKLTDNTTVSSYMVCIAEPQNWYAKTVHERSMITVGRRIVKPKHHQLSLVNT